MRWALAGCLLLLMACQSDQSPTTLADNGIAGSSTPLFRLLPPEQTGVHFSNPLEENAQMNIFLYDYYYSGGGVAIGDVNGDQKPDIYFTANLIANRLFLNEGNMQFREATEAAGLLGSQGWTTGVTMADINGDGHLDIYVCKSGKFPEELRRNQLFINNGDGVFTEQGALWGLDDPGYSMQAVFFDYDNDNDLDCYLLNHPVQAFRNIYVEEIRKERDPLAGDKLYRNDGDKFTDVSAAAGIFGSPIGFGLGVAVADFNRDGYLDLYVSNDFTEHDFYYINQRNGTFRESLKATFGHTSHFSMGNDVQDINHDGWPDLVVLDMLPEDNYRQKILRGPNGYDKYQLQVAYGFHHQQMRNTLQVNNGDGSFSETGQLAGISNTDWSWAPLLADYDNDGWPDLYVTNGFKRDYTNMDFLKYDAPEAQRQAQLQGQQADLGALVRQMPSVQIPNYAFRNRGDGTFEKVSAAWGLQQPSFSNGAAWGDLDGDGDLDLVVNNIDAKAFIYENTAAGAGNHWLQVALEGPPGNRTGIGALVRVTTENGRQEQLLILTRGFISSVEPILQFGLGNAAITEVAIRWPDGKVQILQNVTANTRLTFQYLEAEAGEWRYEQPEPLFRKVSAPVFTHRNNAFIDLKREPLLHQGCSAQGPVMAAGDVNGDGLTDLYVGGSVGEPAQLFLQQRNGRLVATDQPAFRQDKSAEDGDAIFADIDNDGDLDLIVASAGYELQPGDEALAPRLYTNKGDGNFVKGDFPAGDYRFTQSGIAVADFNQDGQAEIFLGGRWVPGRYGDKVESMLYQQTNNQWTPVPLPAQPAGMVTAARWADVDGNGWADLVVVGEWMPVTVYLNSNGTLQAPQLLDNSSGWWYSLKVTDVDGDGDEDIIAGNRGMNAQVQAVPGRPATLYVKDFDGNGVLDPLLTYFIGDRAYPAASRDDLLDQLNFLKKRYTRYAAYGSATYESMLTEEERAGALAYRAETFASTVFRNQGDGRFVVEQLPPRAQVAPVWGIATRDLNGDGLQDLVLTGNFFDTRAEDGPFDGSRGVVLLQMPGGGWKALSTLAAGLQLTGDSRGCVWMNDVLVVATNNGPLQLYRYEEVAP